MNEIPCQEGSIPGFCCRILYLISPFDQVESSDTYPGLLGAQNVVAPHGRFMHRGDFELRHLDDEGHCKLFDSRLEGELFLALMLGLLYCVEVFLF